jgi:hypothetical protein
LLVAADSVGRTWLRGFDGGTQPMGFTTTIKVGQPSQRNRCPKNTNELGRWQGLPAPTLFFIFLNYE